MATIYLVRHGQASFGQHDYDRLSPIGERQAVITGEWMKTVNRTFTLSASGTLLRQRQTLAGIFNGMGLEDKQADTILPGLDELDVDDLLLAANPDFSSRKEFDAHMMNQPNPGHVFFEEYRSALQRWSESKHDDSYKESWSTFKSRTLGAVKQAADELGDNDSAVLVSSGGVIATVDAQCDTSSTVSI